MLVMGATKYEEGLVVFAGHVIYRNPQTGLWEDIPLAKAKEKKLINEGQPSFSGGLATVKDIVAYLRGQDER